MSNLEDRFNTLRAEIAERNAAAQAEQEKVDAYWADVVSDHIAQRWERVAAANEAGDWALSNRLTRDTMAYERMNGRESLR